MSGGGGGGLVYVIFRLMVVGDSDHRSSVKSGLSVQNCKSS